MLKKYFDEDKYEELKASDNLIYKALEIATTLFENDVDKGGMPYMLHIEFVYKHVYSIHEKVVALLHDVIEDKDVSGKDLLEIGFPKEIVDDDKYIEEDKSVDSSDHRNGIAGVLATDGNLSGNTRYACQ